jgi:hypothetical protein
VITVPDQDEDHRPDASLDPEAQMILSGSRSGPSCRGWRGHASGWRVCWPSAS